MDIILGVEPTPAWNVRPGSRDNFPSSLGHGPENPADMLATTVGWLALVATTASAPDESAARPEMVTLSGRFVLLPEALKPLGVAFDPEPVARQVVLLGRDGTITPLLCDDASRALFVDGRLRGRPAEMTARRYRGVPFVQVMTFRVEDQGALRTPEYFCEICTISVRYPQICPCCQGPMELRMKPDER
jgi:hypothetical protein